MSSSAAPLQSLITSDDHSPVVRFAAATLLTLTLLSLAVRLVWIRWPLRSLFGHDDLATIIGVVSNSYFSLLHQYTTDSGRRYQQYRQRACSRRWNMALQPGLARQMLERLGMPRRWVATIFPASRIAHYTS